MPIPEVWQATKALNSTIINWIIGDSGKNRLMRVNIKYGFRLEPIWKQITT